MSAYSTYTDQELTDLLKLGSRAAFTELYGRYIDPLLLHAHRMLGDTDEAKDIVQDVFTALWDKRENLSLPTSVEAYLYGAIRNRILNFIAHQKVIARYTDSIDSYLEMEAPTADEQLVEKELIATLRNEIALLPEKMRKVFELSRKESLSHKQIAEQLNISDKTVKKQIGRAIKILKYKINLSLFLTFFG